MKTLIIWRSGECYKSFSWAEEVLRQAESPWIPPVWIQFKGQSLTHHIKRPQRLFTSGEIKALLRGFGFGLTCSLSQLFTQTYVGELQHLLPFLAFSFSVSAASCKTNRFGLNRTIRRIQLHYTSAKWRKGHGKAVELKSLHFHSGFVLCVC